MEVTRNDLLEAAALNGILSNPNMVDRPLSEVVKVVKTIVKELNK